MHNAYIRKKKFFCFVIIEKPVFGKLTYNFCLLAGLRRALTRKFMRVYSPLIFRFLSSIVQILENICISKLLQKCLTLNAFFLFSGRILDEKERFLLRLGLNSQNFLSNIHGIMLLQYN